MNNIFPMLKMFAVEQCIDTSLFGQVCDDCHGGAIFKLLAVAIQVFTAGIMILATVSIVWAGVLYLSARDDEAQVAKAKKRILDTVIGIAAYGLMFVILNLIIPGGVTTNRISASDCPEIVIPTPSAPSDPGAPGDPGTPGSPSTPPTPSTPASYPDGYTSVPEGADKVTKINILGEDWIVVNTKTSVLEYDKIIKKHKVAQDKQTCPWGGGCYSSGADNDKCMSFAETFTYDMYYGTTTSDVQAPKWARSYYVSTSIKEDDVKKVLAVLYNQVNGGLPAVAQVSYNADFNKKDNTRHFISVVGYRASVKSASELKVEDLLIMNTNGHIQPATAKGSGKAYYGGGSAYASYLPLIPGSITNHRKKYTGYYLRLINLSRQNHKKVDKH